MPKRTVVASLMGVAGLLWLILSFTGQPPEDVEVAVEGLTPVDFLGVAGGEFTDPASPWDFRFPEDHGPHTGYRTEWWHLAGALESEKGEPLGMQLVIVRVSLSPVPSEHPSRWATNDIYASMLAVNRTDLRRLHTDQRVTRGGALGLAEWRSRPMRLRVEDWWIQQSGYSNHALDLNIGLSSNELKLDLELKNQRSIMDMNDVSGNRSDASLPFAFYLQPHLRAAGSISMGGQAFKVDGDFLLEHAWGELPLPGGAVARDRFMFYLDDGNILILNRTHSRDPGIASGVSGFLLAGDGGVTLLSRDEVELKPVEFRKSADTNASYPIDWQLNIQGLDIDANIVSTVDNGEGALWTPFWIGPVHVQEPGGVKLGGGLVQLTGYGGER